MSLYNIYSSIFLGVISIFVCIISYKLGLGEIHTPGPGLIPFGVAVILLLMSLGLAIRSVLEILRKPQKSNIFRDVYWKRVIIVIIFLMGYGIFFNILGFGITNFILLALLIGLVGKQKWWATFLISISIVIIIYFIFIIWLDIPFPRGILGI